MTENEIAQIVVDTAFHLHKAIGPGLLESAYEHALKYDLEERGLNVQSQVAMPFEYKGVKLDVGYRIDLLVEDKLVVEIKSVEQLAPVHFAQTLTYLRLSDIKLGLLINFNSKLLKDGMHRLVNGL
ncbi:GxxExxY protein [Carboxylicivirga marina]|uniref:GxxExxY protein n=1 Tax=Carboxylicivirga marina TaxID=2800988 RepID=A0ABS1HK57_9BACT|nr:GxxExxY protein [Carboxylicivirga marina]MBK3518021.1 GxxExxY protein [Carboxylicivirga marina]